MSGLVDGLRDAGWNASHRFHISDRAYRGSHSKLARLWLRIRMYLCYPVALLWSLLWARKPLVAVVCTNTFYAPLFAAFLARRRGAKTVHLVYDLFPDALLISGHLKEYSFPARVLSSVTDATMNACDRNVFLGEHLLRFARERHPDIPRAAVIPVGASGDAFPNPPQAEQTRNGPLLVLYCGNLGYMHDIDTFTGALAERSSALAGAFRFLFQSSGPGLENLNNGVAALPDEIRADVRLEKNLPHDAWVETMASAQIGLVTMVPGAERVVMPSKAYSAMMAGQAILAICPRESDLADTILKYDCGWVIEPGDSADLGALFATIAADPGMVHDKRLRAFQAAHEHLDNRAVAKQWAALFEELGASPGDRHAA